MPSEGYVPSFKDAAGHDNAVRAHALITRPRVHPRAAQRARINSAPIATQMRFSRNQTIFSEGERSTQFYMVVSGAVRICNYIRDGRRQVADFMFPNDYFGILPYPDYCETAEAISDVVLMRYAHPAMASLEDQQGSNALSQYSLEFRRHLLQLLLRRVRAMERHLLLLGKKTAQERIATILVMLSERLANTRGELFEIPLSRRDMADYLGLTIETVSRGMTQFKRKHLIEIPAPHHLVVTNIRALYALAAGMGKAA